MTVATRPLRPEPTTTNASTARVVEDVLDSLELAERSYHHLNFTMPLVIDLVERVRRVAGPGDEVLLLGGSSLLAEALLRLGYRPEILQFRHTDLTPAVSQCVSRFIEPDELAALDLAPRRYRAIIAPFVVESLSDPAPFLRRLRAAIAPGGHIVLATSNQSRLQARLAAFAGQPFMPKTEAASFSLSWPSLPVLRYHHRSEIIEASRDAGLRVIAGDYLMSERAFMEMELLNVADYAMRKLGRAMSRVVPSLRDVIVFELSERPGNDERMKTGTEIPSVSVFVAVRHGSDRLRHVLGCLSRQTYPVGSYEVVVLHDGSREDVAPIVDSAAESAVCRIRGEIVDSIDGPGVRNRAMAGTMSDISAHTEDSCELPEDWIQAAIAWFDADTAVITGPVFAMSGSDARYLDVPATRPDPDAEGLASQELFPITNVFYRTQVALAAGGFDRAFDRDDSPAFGWDTELAWRLHRAGWHARFREEVYQFRYFAPERDRSRWIKDGLRRSAELPALVAASPEYGERALVSRVFASKRTMYFDLGLAGLFVAAARRRWPWLLLGIPWLASLSHRIDAWPPRSWLQSLRTFARIGVRQLVWLAGFIVGSIRARRIML